MTRNKIFSITRKDFKVETMRGSGAGGQHRNKTDSAVRITHISSGASSYCCTHREQSRNKKEAFRSLVEGEKFQNWLKIETYRKTGVLLEIEKQVEKEMNESNLLVEVKDGNKWVEEGKVNNG